MPIGSLYTTGNVVVGQAALFVATANTPLPDLSSFNTADPFDTNFWSSPIWTPAGATDQGWSTNFNKQVQNINIEEQSIPVAQTITSQELQFNGTLAEDSSAALALSLNALKTSVAAIAGVSNGTLAGALVSGTQYTTITTSALPVAIPAGGAISLTNGANTQTIYSPAGAAAGATTVTVSQFTANFSYPITTTTIKNLGKPGYDSIALQDTPLYFAVGLTTVNEKGFGRVYYVPNATQIAPSQTAFRRAAALRNHPVTFQSLCKPSQIVVENFTAVALP